MPYFLYRFGALGIPELLGEEPKYRAAKVKLADLRAKAGGPEPAAAMRMVFATNEIEAQDLLTNPRPADPGRDAEDD